RLADARADALVGDPLLHQGARRAARRGGRVSLPAGTAPCARTGGTPELAHAALGALLAVVPAVVAVALLDRLAAGVLAAAAVVVAAGVALPARAVPLRCA